VNIDSVGVLEPLPEKRQVLHAEVEGFVDAVPARDGQRVKAGDVILRISNKQLDTQRERLEAQWQKYDAEMVAYVSSNVARYRVAKDQRDTTASQLEEVKKQLAKLTLRAEIDGELVAPNLHELHKAYLPRGQQVATVIADRRQLVARVVLQQRDAGPVLAEEPKTELRPAGAMATVLPAVGVRMLPAPPEQLPSSVLGQAAGEDLPVDPRDPSGRTAQVRQFEVGVTVDNPGEVYQPGQRAYVRFKLKKRPLIWQWTRRLFQLIQTKSGESEWN
jgi:multidrug efflux pump subunit AcrA (membrane-fusion protein)